MTIDEAIEMHEKRIKFAQVCIPCSGCPIDECIEEHQLHIEWLKELKKLREFAHYVANTITAEEEEFDENPRFFGEVYCRKLHKLGIIKMVDDKWVYEEVIQNERRQL